MHYIGAAIAALTYASTDFACFFQNQNIMFCNISKAVCPTKNTEETKLPVALSIECLQRMISASHGMRTKFSDALRENTPWNGYSGLIIIISIYVFKRNVSCLIIIKSASYEVDGCIWAGSSKICLVSSVISISQIC